jgi:hypothetical protein
MVALPTVLLVNLTCTYLMVAAMLSVRLDITMIVNSATLVVVVFHVFQPLIARPARPVIICSMGCATVAARHLPLF